MAEQTIDVKQAADASAAAATQANVEQDVKQGAEQSSATQEDVKKEPTLQDVVQGVLDKHKPDSSTEGKKKEGEVLNKDATKTEEKTTVKKEEAVVKDKSVEEDITKYPPRAQERIRALVEERKTVEAKVKEFEPVVQRMQNVETFCRTKGINPQEFQQLLETGAVIKSGSIEQKKEALKQLTTLMDVLKVEVGEGLPVDLQARVDDGKLDLVDAKALAKARVEETRFKQERQASAENQQQTVQRELTSTFQQWDTTKRTSDPDFKPKTNGEPDGKYELVYQKFQELWRTVPVNTIMDAVGLLEKAHQEVDATITRFRPTPPQRRVVTSSRSSTNKTGEPEKIDFTKPGWARKVAAQVMEK